LGNDFVVGVGHGDVAAIDGFDFIDGCDFETPPFEVGVLDGAEDVGGFAQGVFDAAEVFGVNGDGGEAGVVGVEDAELEDKADFSVLPKILHADPSPLHRFLRDL
jgi:hypothetical protein